MLGKWEKRVEMDWEDINETGGVTRKSGESARTLHRVNAGLSPLALTQAQFRPGGTRFRRSTPELSARFICPPTSVISQGEKQHR
jgi:hypothetical protein